MEYIPSATSFRRALEYGAVVVFAALFVASVVLPAGILWDGAVFVIAIGVSAYLLLSYRKQRMYGFDAKGVYRSGRLLFSWSQVKRLSLNFRGHGDSVTLVAWPTWAALVSGGPFESASFVDYDVALAFELEDGRKASIPSNLERLVGRVMERLDELAKSANQKIVLE